MIPLLLCTSQEWWTYNIRESYNQQIHKNIFNYFIPFESIE